MIDWINDYARAWGACNRWLRATTNEGYPHSDVSARMADGALSASSGTLRQHFPEVRTARALAVQRVLQTPPLMGLEARTCFDIHYTERCPQRYKLRTVAALLQRDISTSEYFRRLDQSHYHLAARITPIEEKPLGAIVAV